MRIAEHFAFVTGLAAGDPGSRADQADQPLRGVLLGPEALEARAAELAAGACVRTSRGEMLLGRFMRSSRTLLRDHHAIAAAAQRGEVSGGEADWLLDNFHIIAEALRQVRSDLPPGYYRQLPKLAQGPFRGYPRVYELAIDLLAHSDSALDEANIFRFIQSYQGVRPLTIGELWAAPTMLRIALLENLRRLARQIVVAFAERQSAATWNCRHALPEPCTPSFALRVADLSAQDEAAKEGLEKALAARGLSLHELQQAEQQRQAGNQVSIGNCVTSLRLLSALDWTDFFERASVVEEILRQDPSGTHAQQDFRTRDRCRQAVERLARGSRVSEAETAHAAVELARQARERPVNLADHYLIGSGQAVLERRLGYRPTWGERLRRAALARPEWTYFGGVVGLSGAFLAGLLWLAGPLSGGMLVLLGALLLLPATEVALALLHRLIAALLPPRPLPRLEFAAGLPADCATFIVVPGLLNQPEDATALLRRLEIHHHAAPDPQFRYALLTDFSDAAEETRPEDEAIVQAALAGVAELNRRYAGNGPPRFFVFHRRRKWNPSQGCWMGWERKRGKLAEFNKLLRGDPSGFAFRSGEPAPVPHVRFVITLDADTQLPSEAAPRLVATLAHPLNRPRYDPARRRIVSGYGILQPRVSFSLVGAARSAFARLYSASAGIDPYAAACSDAYQDLFGQGSFTGKGIYDVDAFEAAAGPTFPENRILSHDLIEGNYARCGLCTDTELFDDFPARYLTFARREHRWARGDWQLLPWLLPQAPRPVANGDSRLEPNPLPAVERWKVFDNLRRSLAAPSLLLALILGWILTPALAWAWTGIAALVCLWPMVVEFAFDLLGWLRNLAAGRRLPPLGVGVPTALGQGLLKLALLAEHSFLMVDAIGRTLYRLFISRRNLLEWETAAAAERRFGNDLRDFLRPMWFSPTLALGVAALVAFVAPAALPAAAPLLLVWLAAPLLAWRFSQPPAEPAQALGEADVLRLRLLARQTWSFFETYVGAQDNWLPPDNYQEHPKGEVAHRTSPTNVGLYLVSSLAAYDLGYLGLPGLLERIEKTFATLGRLPRHHGHFYNWHDTVTLLPLAPAYVSTVDSGNLYACLLTVRRGLEEATVPRSVAAVRAGLQDTLALAALAVARPQGAVADGVADDLAARLAALGQAIAALPDPPEALAKALREAEQETAALLVGLDPEAEQSLEAAAVRRWLTALAEQLRHHAEDAATLGKERDELERRCRTLADQAATLAAGMDFKILYNAQRHLFSVGFNLAQGKLDGAHYDLLASEACLTSFLAIAKGDAPRRHWFQLGRPRTRAGEGTALVSWSGTMFEYLMPLLFLPDVPETLLHESRRAAVASQIAYARRRGVPWGISESAHSTMDGELNYQYQAFGVPELGLKRGLASDLVVAPYASMLAVGLAPQEALRNFTHLEREGAMGPHGFYEAVDYTAERLPKSARKIVVKCFMAHHQGMALTALANALLDNAMRRRLRAEPMVRATELLLQERLPLDLTQTETPAAEASPAPAPAPSPPAMSRRLTSPHTAYPRTHLLAGAGSQVSVSNSGSSRSRRDDIDVTRWREDRTCDDSGQFLYLRDLRTGQTWSAGHQPLRRPADEYEVIFATDKAEFRRRDGLIETHLEIAVSPEDGAEARRLTLTNTDTRPHDIEAFTYGEVVLLPHDADLAHPAFGKLFVEAEFLQTEDALVFKRRPRGPHDQPIWAVHVAAAEGELLSPVRAETDRGRFLGRGRTVAAPAALEADEALSAEVGSSFDPIFSLRSRVRVPAKSSVILGFTTTVAASREEALQRADQYHDLHAVNRVFDLAWAHSQVELRHLHLTAEETHLFQRLAGHLLFALPALRAEPAVVEANRLGFGSLWGQGISGDRPILLAKIEEEDELLFVRELLAAHRFWRSRGLEVDLVILNVRESGYLQDLQQKLERMIHAGEERAQLEKPGGLFLRRASHLAPADLGALLAASRCVLDGRRGSLASQLDRLDRALPAPPQEPPPPKPPRPSAAKASPAAPLFAGLWGGFTSDGREYILDLPPAPLRRGRPAPAAVLPPAPWINVVANPNFGFLVSEAGAGFTWAGNSQTNRLTPWRNDPVCDLPSEAIYLRDEATGAVWSPTPFPCGTDARNRVRHGAGHTVFEQERDGLVQELTLFVHPTEAVKVMRLKVTNRSDRALRLSATCYAEWALGGVREKTAPHVLTWFDREAEALFARNPFNPDFGSQAVFLATDVPLRGFTADRTEFLGRNGTLAAPAALAQSTLNGAVGAGLDPCAAVQTDLLLPPGAARTVHFFLGQGADEAAATRLLRACREPGWAEAAWQACQQGWKEILETIQVHTPEPELDVLLNRWLPYQVLSCRFWGRSALYQSGGAFGFRDQLQDALALVYAAPGETRAHLLRAAGRQFVEGDVQHWWHPPHGAGVRTRITDDLLWLPYAVARYAAITGDAAVWEEAVPFLKAPELKPGQDDDYRIPETADEGGTLYEHCLLAVNRACRFGPHGLPLMGSGDWNDGMNQVGHEGVGESVWNGWFLHSILTEMACVAEGRQEPARAAGFRATAATLLAAIEAHGWDGAWYRRAYFDDGTPMGSAQNAECRIDSLPQSWAAITGAGDPRRAQQALAEADAQLVREQEKLILLFAPPFDQGGQEPGYVKGYLPGVRENGGQYTHAALWLVQAMTALGRGGRALELLRMLNPINHGRTRADAEAYRLEPYAVAADIAGAPPHLGRGGWSWYTGSAAWFYRVALENILGFQRRGATLTLRPCVPKEWKEYAITYRFGATTYAIQVLNPKGLEAARVSFMLDGVALPEGQLPLFDDGKRHRVVAIMQ